MKQLFTLLTIGLLWTGCQQSTQKNVDTKETTTAQTTEVEQEQNQPYTETTIDCSSDRQIPTETAVLWKNAWLVYQQMLASQTQVSINVWDTYAFSKEKVEETAPLGVTPNGLRVYYGLNQFVAEGNPVGDHLAIIVVATEATGLECNDIYRDDNMVLAFLPSAPGQVGGEQWITKQMAEDYVANWKNYMDAMALPHDILTVYAYNFQWDKVINAFGSLTSNTVHFTPALHTINFPSHGGFQEPGTTHNPCNEPIQGFLAYDLVMQGFKSDGQPLPGPCQGITDFANPCPLFCGQTNLINAN